MITASFDERHIIHELKHYLPSQTPLKDFIHHNTLHAFQDQKFYDAIFKASKIFGYQVTLELNEFRQLYKMKRVRQDVLDRVITERKGAHQLNEWKEKLISKPYDTAGTPRIGKVRSAWKSKYHIDLDSHVHPLLFRILCNYLDQGIALWGFPKGKDLLDSIRELEKSSFTSFFKSVRAKDLLLNSNTTIAGLLKILVGNESFYNAYLFDQQFAHHGWSGLVASIEEVPGSLLDKRKISLHDLIVFELLLEIDALEHTLGGDWQALYADEKTAPEDLFADVAADELNEVFVLWQNAFEWSYFDEVLSGINTVKNTAPVSTNKKSFQAFFCIDERECSLRRHLEATDPDCETFGTPGFFNAEFFFQPENGSFYDKLCPAPVTPKYLIKEFNVKQKRPHDLLYTKLTHAGLRGALLTLTMGFWSGVQLFLDLFRPKMSPAISNAFAHMDKNSELLIENFNLNDRENDLQIGFTITEMADRVEGLLRSIGLLKGFTPIVYVVAHGSSSANNPHHSAHDCGACSGKPGSVNARVFAFMANHSKVRELLTERGIAIPAETHFIGALHDTAADQVAYYDEWQLMGDNIAAHKVNATTFEKALDLNAKERSRRFASIDTKQNLTRVRKVILQRSVSMFEPRPELGHGTNSLCIVGSRDLTKKLFLDRRAFLNSYDHRTDPEGKLLAGVMRPLGPVCGGISLEYYFSRVDNHKLGAGTKLPHHVMGLIGVANSVDGDLRPGLPLQMIEVHDPVRLLVIVEHFPEVVLRTIKSAPEMYEWYRNEWIHLVALDPATKKLFRYKEGAFSEYTPLLPEPGILQDVLTLFESAEKMKTNKIADATRENLAVQVLN